MNGRRFLPDLRVVLGLAAIYFIAGKLGLKLAFVHANATPVWPPTGIAVATSLGIAMGNTLEGVVAAALVNRYAQGSNAFDRPQDLLKFVLLAGLLSPIVSSTFGVTSLSLGGYASWSQYGSIWFTWWLGDVGGALLVAPLIVVWGRARRRWKDGSRRRSSRSSSWCWWDRPFSADGFPVRSRIMS